MPRQRMIKPEFWFDERVNACSIPARLLFIATWNFADDEGNLARSSKQLKAQTFPYDVVDCEPWVKELIAQGLLMEYEADARQYLHIPNFKRHQIINRPSKPLCPAPTVTCSEPASNVRQPNAVRQHPYASTSLSARAEVNKEKRKKKESPAKRARISHDAVFSEVQNRQLVEDWLKVRRAKKLAVTETALAGFRREAEKSGHTLEFVLRLCCEKNWGGFEARFLEKIQLDMSSLGNVGEPFDPETFYRSVGA